MPGLEWVIYALALVALWLGAMAAHGRFGGMPPAVVDVPQPTLAEGALTADELRTVRLAVVPRGYSIAQVDALLERVARQLDVADEGCLSLPGAFTECGRPDHSWVTGVDHLGEPVEFEGTGLLARCLQHETDHLFGTVFGDRVPEKARKKLYKLHKQVADEYADDWPVGEEVD